MHQCFRKGCDVQVEDKLLACARDWHKLTAATQRAIYRTLGLHLMHPERRAALRAAQADWGN